MPIDYAKQDRAWFKAHPGRRFRLRDEIPGEWDVHPHRALDKSAGGMVQAMAYAAMIASERAELEELARQVGGKVATLVHKQSRNARERKLVVLDGFDGANVAQLTQAELREIWEGNRMLALSPSGKGTPQMQGVSQQADG